MPDVQGLISDPEFQALAPERQRAILEHIGVDPDTVQQQRQAPTQGLQPSTYTRTGEPVTPLDLSMTDIGGRAVGGEQSPYVEPIGNMMGTMASLATLGGAGGAVVGGLRAGLRPAIGALTKGAPRLLRNMGIGGLIGGGIEAATGGDPIRGATTGAVVGATGGGSLKDLTKKGLTRQATKAAASKATKAATANATSVGANLNKIRQLYEVSNVEGKKKIKRMVIDEFGEDMWKQVQAARTTL